MHVNADNISPVPPSALAKMQLGNRPLAEWIERAKVATPLASDADDVVFPSYREPRQRVAMDRLLDDVKAAPSLDEAAARVEAEQAAYHLGEQDALAGGAMSPRFGDDQPNLQNAYVDGFVNGTEYSG